MKNKAISSLPNYAMGKLGNNQDFMNHSMTTSIWKIERCEMGTIEIQPNSPIFGIRF